MPLPEGIKEPLFLIAFHVLNNCKTLPYLKSSLSVAEIVDTKAGLAWASPVYSTVLTSGVVLSNKNLIRLDHNVTPSVFP